MSKNRASSRAIEFMKIKMVAHEQCYTSKIYLIIKSNLKSENLDFMKCEDFSVVEEIKVFT